MAILFRSLDFRHPNIFYRLFGMPVPSQGHYGFQFSGCWLILSVYILMSFDFPFVRLFGVRVSDNPAQVIRGLAECPWKKSVCCRSPNGHLIAYPMIFYWINFRPMVCPLIQYPFLSPTYQIGNNKLKLIVSWAVGLTSKKVYPKVQSWNSTFQCFY